MDALLRDLKHAFRSLSRAPGFAAAAVVTLALGIGANTAIYSVVDAVLLKPLPYADPGRLVMVYERNLDRQNDRNVVSPGNFLDWRAQSRVFEDMAGYLIWRTNLTGLGEPEEVPIQLTTASFFPVLGVKPAIGRAYTAQEDAPGGENVVVLGHGFWQRHFAGDPGVLGKKITLGGRPATVIGVMPAGFTFGRSTAELWAPFGLDPSLDYRKITGRYMEVVARLKPGVTPGQAHAEMKALAARLEQQFPDFNAHWSANVVPLEEQVVGGIRRALLVLAGVVGFVLLIACANVANLMLARAAARQREIAVRTALGASAWRVVRQMLTESVVLSIAGGALGLVLALWGTSALVAAAPAALPRVQEVTVDARVLAFTVAVSLAAGVLFGLVPAWQATRASMHATLKEGARGSSAGGGRTRGALVISQVALSLVLLVGAGLMIKSFARLTAVSPGFDPERVLTARLSLPRSKYRTPESQVQFFDRVLERVRALPDVQAASAINWLPFAGLGSATNYWVAERPVPPSGEHPTADIRGVDPQYFQTMKIKVLQGEPLTERETRDVRKAVVINETLARTVFPNESPLGRHIMMPWDDTLNGEIVGVVADARHAGLDSVVNPMIYWAQAQFPSSSMTLVVRSRSADPMRLASAVTREVRALDPELPVADVKAMDDYLGASVARRRFSVTLLALFAGVALVLAAVGLYGVIAYGVAMRTREIGVRIALGARRPDVLRLVIREGMGLVLAGVAAGVLGALFLTRVLANLLYGVSATDPATFVSIAALLSAVALVAAYIPARRAAAVDPMVALREE
ncbi:MAG TPA: ABC transporter permease [Gemmatimonadaceae bacterium]|nr:ABC transporter permease [Gemmatimonadaceae bacterium]